MNTDSVDWKLRAERAEAGLKELAEACDKAKAERDKALAELETLKQPALATHQPCGCQLCVCAGEDRCGGCGAHSCRTEQCVMTKRPDLRVYDDAPTYAQLQAERDKALQDLAAIKAQVEDYTAVTDIKVIQLIIDRDKALADANAANSRVVELRDMIFELRRAVMYDPYNQDERSATPVEQLPLVRRAQKLLDSTGCGKGWLSPEKAKELEDRIRQLEFDHDQWFVSRETCVELRKQVKLLVEALERIRLLTEAWNQISFQTIAKKVAKEASEALAAVKQP